MPISSVCYYANPAKLYERQVMMREVAQQVAHDMVESGYDTSFIDFNNPADILCVLREFSDAHIDSGNNNAMWVHACHERGFEKLDLENLRLEFNRVYNNCLELDRLGAFDMPDDPVEPEYDPIEAMRSYGSDLLRDAIRIHASKGDVYGNPY